jgi:hypothetical protein
LQRRAARLMGTARRLSRETGETAHVYSECRYAAGTWEQRRRVIIKAEVVRHPGREPRNNPRFVVTHWDHAPLEQTCVAHVGLPWRKSRSRESARHKIPG